MVGDLGVDGGGTLAPGADVNADKKVVDMATNPRIDCTNTLAS